MASLSFKEGSLSTKEIADLRVRVCDLDAKYASLCAEEQLGMNVENTKAAVLREIQAISQLISECEKELARRPAVAPRPPVAVLRQQVAVSRPQVAVTRPPVAVLRPPVAVSRPPVAVLRPPVAVSRPQVAFPQNDSPQIFLQYVIEAVQLMASSGVPRVFSNSVFSGEYLPVRGDGNCGLRAFLTALAARAGRHLPIDPPGMLELIFRLKPLMIQEINQMLSAGIIDERNLLSIPENRFSADATLDDYFARFLTDGYHITNFDFRVLASMFNLQINVIRQNTNGIDDVQCFVRHGNEIDLNIVEHICILQQPGHFVPFIQVFESASFGSIDCLHSAIGLGFTG